MSIKRAFFWVHLAVGIVCGLFIGLLALTGASIAYGPQLIEFAQRDVTRVAVTGTSKLPIEELLKKAGEKVPGLTPSGIFVYADPARSVMIGGGRGKPSYYVNPYTGEVKEQGAGKTRATIEFMTGLHRWLALSGNPNDAGSPRNIGKTITGSAALGFASLCITGLVIWWPRQLKLRVMKPSIWFMKGVKGKVRDWNWHNVFGFWFLPVLATLAITGAMIGFPWARGLIYYAVGEKPPVRGEGPPGEGRQRGGETAAPQRRNESETPATGERPANAEGSENRMQAGGVREEATRGPAITPPSPGAKPIGYDRAIEIVTTDTPHWESVSFRMGNAGDRRGEGRQRRGEGAQAGSEAMDERRESAPRIEGAAGGEEPRARRTRTEGQTPAGETAGETRERAPRAGEDETSGEEARPRRRRDGARGATAALNVSVKRDDTAPLFAQVAYSLNPYTGEILKRETFDGKTLGEKLGGSVRNVHTGEGFGWPGQTVMFLGCVAAVILAYTGFALSWRRFFPSRKKRHHQHRNGHVETPGPAA